MFYSEEQSDEESNLMRIYIIISFALLRMTYAECGFLTFVRNDIECHSEECSDEESNLMRIYIIISFALLRMTCAECGFLTFVGNDIECHSEECSDEESNLLRIYILRPCLRMTCAECGFLAFARNDSVCVILRNVVTKNLICCVFISFGLASGGHTLNVDFSRSFEKMGKSS